MDIVLSSTKSNYRLVTAEIFYYIPDYPDILQSYIWQGFDYSPDYPALKKFLTFWEESLDGKIHSVTVCSVELNQSREFRYAKDFLQVP